MSCCELGFSWLFLSIRFYCPLYSEGPQDYILYLYRAATDKFLVDVQHQLIHVKESLKEHRLWARLFSSSSVLHVLFVWFEWFLRKPSKDYHD